MLFKVLYQFCLATELSGCILSKAGRASRSTHLSKTHAHSQVSFLKPFTSLFFSNHGSSIIIKAPNIFLLFASFITCHNGAAYLQCWLCTISTQLLSCHCSLYKTNFFNVRIQLIFISQAKQTMFVTLSAKDFHHSQHSRI